jgi:transaldolase
MTTPLHKLAEAGQSVWYDNISRDLLTSGELEKLRRRGIRGVTSNPTIFEKAIAETKSYDPAVESLAKKGLDARQVFEHLAIDDIRAACDVLRPVFDETKGQDGYVSLEVSPELAFDTTGTLADAKRLHGRIERENVMIKIPGTKEGLPAVKDAIAAGVNINITLLFAVDVYDKVIDAYMTGLEERVNAGKPIDKIASVASFFVSRVDTKVDKLLEDAAVKSPANAATLKALQGKAAIANARLAYRLFLDRFQSPRFAALAAKGGRVQRPLWASTSTKNPAYRDVVYCEELIGPDTVNTMPPATVKAFEDHGVVKRTLPEDVSESNRTLKSLAAAGIDIHAVCAQLVDEGVRSFAKSFTDLLAAVERKRTQLLTAK